MTAPRRRRALLIGTENHTDARFAALPSTRADTKLLGQVLGDRNIGEFTEIRIKPDLRADEMCHTIEAFLRDCKADELALLYISGHGTRSITSQGEFFFVAADTDQDHIDDTGVGAKFINECLEDCWAAQKIAILDYRHRSLPPRQGAGTHPRPPVPRCRATNSVRARGGRPGLADAAGLLPGCGVGRGGRHAAAPRRRRSVRVPAWCGTATHRDVRRRRLHPGTT